MTQYLVDETSLYEAFGKIDPENIGEQFKNLAKQLCEQLGSNPQRLTFEGAPNIEQVDNDVRMIELSLADDEEAPYVQLKSWDPNNRHLPLKVFEDATTLRITVEITE